MHFRRLKALRPLPELVSGIASVPYDVVSSEEARQQAGGLPDSLLHIVKAEINFPPGKRAYDDDVYEVALKQFQRLQDEGKLVREDEPCVYLYRQIMGEHSQRGILGLCHVDDYDNNVIRKHEKTRQDKEDDRTRLTDTLSANPGPVFLAYRDREGITAIMDKVEKDGEPLFDMVAPDGVRHTVWKMVDEAAGLEDAFSRIPVAYVADGHHRTASAARVARERREGNPHHHGQEDYNWFLSVLFPADELAILPYNRWVETLQGLGSEAFLEALSRLGTLEKVEDGNVPEGSKVRIYLENQWYELSFERLESADPAQRLDVSWLQEKVLAPFLGVDDPRTCEHIQFVGGIRGCGELEKMVQNAPGSVAFSLYPVTVEELMAIADSGGIMPPKSTWFEPKLRSGLVIHTF